MWSVVACVACRVRVGGLELSSEEEEDEEGDDGDGDASAKSEESSDDDEKEEEEEEEEEVSRLRGSWLLLAIHDSLCHVGCLYGQ